ncbi:MAG: DUF2306 domain-containing protein [Vicinamibacterales bacterium]
MAVTLEPQLPAVSPARAHRTALVALSLVFLAGVVFVVVAALPYFALNEAQFDRYWTRRWWLLAHISTGMVALLSGPFQLWLGISDQRPGLHRRLGYIYMTAIALSAATAYYLAFTTDLGVAFGSGLAGLATAWLITTGMAFTAIRKQLYDQHKEWMIRSYVVTTAFVAFRIIFPLLQTSGVGNVQEQLAVAAWGCWALPLLITEAVLQGRKILAVKSA